MFPMSFLQEHLWLVDQLRPDNAPYNLAYILDWDGPLNHAALRKSLDEIVRRHEILRTVFRTFDGEPSQVVMDPGPVSMPVVDLQPEADAGRESKFRALTAEQAEQQFDLAAGPLFRFCLVRFHERKHVLLFVTHNIVFDSASAGVFLSELALLYETFVSGQPSPLPELTIQYADYAVQQRELAATSPVREQFDYWKRQLRGATSGVEIPADHSRGSEKTFAGAQVAGALPSSLSESLEALSRGEGVSLFTLLLAVFQILLHRYTGEDDILVGSASARRAQKATENLMGLFTNTVALRTDVSGNPTCRELLRRVHKTVSEAHEHADAAFEEVLKELHVKHDMSRSPLFQILFAEVEASPEQREIAGTRLSWQRAPTRAALFDLTVSVRTRDECLHLDFGYNSNLFEESTIERLAGHYRALLEAMVSGPDQRIATLPMLTSAELQQLLVEWNDTAVELAEKGRCLHEVIEEQVRRVPDNVAVVMGRDKLTYRELNERANQLAHFLRKRGVGPDALAGLCLERSLEMIVGLLGILKAGGAYVPLDPAYPKDRLEFMREDSGLKVLVTQEELSAAWSDGPAELICLDRDWRVIAQESRENPEPIAGPDNLAYVSYTSGSTGVPKGVQIPHRAVVNFIASMRSAPGITERDTLLAVTTLSFDIAGLEIYLPLAAGARVVVADRRTATDGRALGRAIAENSVTIMQATCSTWRLLVESGWKGKSNLKVLCGGEAFSRDLADELLARAASVWNMYGPTETTIWSTVEKIAPGQGPILIGRPIANTDAYILDNHLLPVPVGIIGELYLGGDGLARGYLNRSELTAERFIRHAYQPGARLYRTGDLARFHPDGRIECLGRTDQQVKLRGYRIELGEIESLLSQQDGVREAAVALREDVAGNKKLVAYLAPQNGATPSAPQVSLLLKKRLPDYMLPSEYVVVAELPRTLNGKIDRNALPAPGSDHAPATVSPGQAPRTETEKALAAIWKEVLGLENLGVRDDFFDLGGHSLLAVKMFAKISNVLGVELSLNTLFESPTIEQLAARIGAPPKEDHERHSLVPIQTTGARPPLYWIPGGRAISVLALREVSLLFGPDQPVYGLESELPESGQEFATVEERAARYIERMRAVQPHGPYYLAGFCTGGMVAYEMAQQLQAQGERVAFLALVQAMVPNYPRTNLARGHFHIRRKRYILAALLRALLLRVTPGFFGVRRAYRQEALDRVAKLFLGWVGTSAQLPDDTQAANERVMRRYQLAPYKGDAHVFLAEDCFETIGAGPRLDPRRAWRQYVQGACTVQFVPGNHYSMLTSPNAAHLAEAMRSKMREDGDDPAGHREPLETPSK